MKNIKGCIGCVLPDLCLVACPHNDILDQLRHPLSEPAVKGLEDEEALLEVRFADAKDNTEKK